MARKSCNAVRSVTGPGGAVLTCGASTVITCGAAKLCRDHQRSWNRDGQIVVFVNQRIRMVKAR